MVIGSNLTLPCHSFWQFINKQKPHNSTHSINYVIFLSKWESRENFTSKGETRSPLSWRMGKSSINKQFLGRIPSVSEILSNLLNSRIQLLDVFLLIREKKNSQFLWNLEYFCRVLRRVSGSCIMLFNVANWMKKLIYDDENFDCDDVNCDGKCL